MPEGEPSDNPKRPMAVAESLEPRMLLSIAPSPAGFHALKWHGHREYARAGEWVLKIDGVTGSPTRQLRLIGKRIHSAGASVSVDRPLGADGVVLIRSASSVKYKAIFSALRQIKGFDYLEPNLALHIDSTTPNDPSFSQQYALAKIHAADAWDITRGDSSAVVGVIDTGVNMTHPDLAANIWTNPAEIANNGIDDDANGFIDDVHGWDFLNDDNDPTDDNSHGTVVAGILSAVGNNGIGVSGVSWNTKIMPIKFLGKDGFGETAGAIAAINYATLMRTRGVNIRITNNSWGDTSFSSALYDAIAASGAAGMLAVAAAGNNNANIDSSPFYPAGFNLPNIISVAWTDQSDNRASLSNYGLVGVDLGAPGSSILSPDLGTGYQNIKSGTSMAAPHVAGAAALAFSISPPSVSYQTIKDAILNGGDAVAALAGKTVTGKRLNAYGTLLQLPMIVTASSPATAAVVATPPTDFSITFSHRIASGSLAASALKVNTSFADSVSLSDSRTALFHFNTSPVSNQGIQTISMIAGAVTRVDDNAGSAAFSSSFRYDAQPMQVVSTSPANGSTIAPPLASIDVTFSEAVDPSSIAPADLTINQGTVLTAAAQNPTKIRYTLSGVSSEGTLTLALAAGALTDAFGNPSLAYSQIIVLDVSTALFPALLTATSPLGSTAYGSSLQGQINSASDSDSFTILLDRGQSLSLLARGQSGLQPTVTLRDSNGVIIGSAPASGGNATLRDLSIPANGTYTITIAAAGSMSGAYTLSLSLNASLEVETWSATNDNTLAAAQNLETSFLTLPGGAQRVALLGRTDPPGGILPAEVEPNNSIATANSAALNFIASSASLYQLDAKGGISSTTDTDYFNIGHFDAGDTLTVAMYGSASSRGTLTNPNLELYRGSSSSPTRVMDDDDSGVVSDSLFYRFPIAVADTYYVRALGSSSQTGTYDLALFLENSGLAPITGGAIATEIDPNDSAATATDVSGSWRIVQYSSSTTGATTSSDHDFLAYPFTAGDLVTINIRAAWPLDAQLSFRTAAGAVITLEDGTSAGLVGNSAIYAFVIPSTGLYLLDPFSRAGAGAYTADVYLSTTTAPAVPPPVPDYYSFSLSAGQHASIAIKSLSGGDLQVELENAQGAALVQATAGPANVDKAIADFTAPSAGTYILRILGGRDLDYNLLLTRGSLFDLEPNNTFASAQTLSGGSSAFGYAGDEDWYQFSASAGDVIQLQTFTPADGPGQFVNTLDPVIDVYTPGGAIITSDDNSSFDGRNARINFTASSSGNYRVRIRAGAAPGEYVLRVTNFSQGLAGTPGPDAYTLNLDASGQNFQIFYNVPATGTPTWTLPKGLLTSLQLNTGDGDDSITIGPAGMSAAGIGLLKVNAGSGANVLSLGGGTTNLDASPDGGLNLSVAADNGTILNLPTSQQLAGLTVNGASRVNLLAGGGRFLRVNALSLSADATLDLADNALILQANAGSRQAALAMISAAIASARNASPGIWSGHGITSSAVVGNGLVGLGVILNDDGHGGRVMNSFVGQGVDENCVLVKFTPVGDLNLDGHVTSDDFFHIDLGFSAGGKLYREGDVDFNGKVNADDYFLMDMAFAMAL